MQAVRPNRVASLILLTVLILATSSAAGAATYYVANTGNDSNPGTQAAPWGTMQHAANVTQPGDLVLVNDGSYAGFLGAASGSPGNPITFRANGNSVIVNQASQNGMDNFNIEGVDYITLDGFIVEDSPRDGIRIALATGVVIQNNTVRRSGRFGILAGFTPQLQVLNNTTSGSQEMHGIYVSNSSDPNDNLIVRGNESFGNNWAGIQINGDCHAGGDGVLSGLIVEQNYLHDNFGKGLSVTSLRNSIIQNNIIANNGITGAAAGIHLTGEPGCNLPSQDNIVANNTIMESNLACIRINLDANTNFIFNNIIIDLGGNGLIVDESGLNTQIDPTSNYQATSNIGVFVNPAGGNYDLQPTSPAIDLGTGNFMGQTPPTYDFNNDSRPQGGGYDAGAEESGGGGVPDVEIPVVGITSPLPNSTVTGWISIDANATDNIGVSRVQFRADGVDIGAADTQAPFSVSLNTNTLINGAHVLSAEAFDFSGNSANAISVNVTVDNTSTPAGDHPRMLPAWRLAQLRQQACYDDNGNVIPGCTPDRRWPHFMTMVGRGQEGWNDALVFQVTGDVSYAQTAIAKGWARVNGGWQTVAGYDPNYLYVVDFLRDVAIIYDLCYDVMSPADRDAYQNYMWMLIYILWNNTDNEFNTWDGWGLSDPNSSFYHNFILATAYVAIATKDEGSFPYTLRYAGVDYPDPMAYTHLHITDTILTYTDTWVGGGMIEGDQYSERSKRMMFEMFIALRDAGERDYFQNNIFATMVPHYMLYSIQPGSRVYYPGGDHGREPTGFVSPYTLMTFLFAAEGLKGTPSGEYAQYWLNHWGPSPPDWDFVSVWDFWRYEPSYPETDYTQVFPTYYHDTHIDWTHSRSSWENDAVTVTFLSQERIQGHQHADQNAFSIFRGGTSPSSIDGWQICDIQPWSLGLPRHSYYHNVFTVNGEAQRYGAGTGDIKIFEATPEYRRMVGDASDAYWTNGFDFEHGDEKMIDLWIREVVHVLPEHIISFDRISPTPAFASAQLISNFHYAGTAPSLNGNVISGGNGPSRIWQTVLLPTDVQMSITNESRSDGKTWKLEQWPGSQQGTYYFLNSFYVTDAGVSSPVPTTLANNLSQNMTGVQIEGPGERLIVQFSLDENGLGPTEGTSIQVGWQGDSKFILFGLFPELEYSVDVVEHEGGKAVSVTPGEGYVASSDGSLVFSIKVGANESEDRIAAAPRYVIKK